ncbi:NACHT domain-containing protein [Oscillatoria acuminata]|uniref:Putative NTPase (NACHT family) n=1 Tax=Oscillatoria acuminata PCC 6304 TaxID=56110 RepID=K9TBI3_9CYAN|nr:HEAT repeat domain-containing protein [Oscillatoria acuminata]AFY79895.1 putative NTPase (NACHT family) [Oscillatoria acuminata PCC 6304]
MGQKGKKNTVQAHQQGIQKLAEAKAAKRNYEGKVWTDLDIAGESGVSEKTVERFFGGQPVLLKTASTICTALGLEVKEVVDPNDWNPPTPTRDKPIPCQNAIAQFLEAIETQCQELRVFHTQQPIVLKHQYIPIEVTLKRRYRHQVETTWGYAESEEEQKRAYALKGMEEESRPVQVPWEKAKMEHQRMIVLADPGMGKSTLLKMEAVSQARQERQKLGQSQAIDRVVFPLFLRLSELQETNAEIIEAIPRLIQRDYPKHWREIEPFLRKKLELGQCLLLLDALDEVPREARNGLREKLSRFTESYRCPLIVTSRIVGYGGGFVTDAKEVEIVPFNPEQLQRYIQTWFVNAAGYIQDETVSASRLIEELKRKPQIQGLAQNPLLLSLICSLYQDKKLTLPTRRVQLYEQVVECMLKEWRGNREPQSDGKILAKLRFLETLAYQFSCQGQEIFTGDELYEAIKQGKNADSDLQNYPTEELMAELSEEDGIIQKLTRDGQNYLFLHRTFQEYFTAGYLNRVMARDPQQGMALVRAHFWEYDWHETLTLLAGLLKNPIPLLEAIAQEKDDIFGSLLLLAGRCLAECENLSHPVSEAICDRLYELWHRYPSLNFISSTVVTVGQNNLQMLQKLQNAALCDSDSDVRRQALEVLGKIGIPEAVPSLIDALCDSDSDIRRYAAITLEKSSTPETVTALIDALCDSDSDVRNNAAITLEKIGTLEVVTALIYALCNSDSDIRRYAALVLGNIGTLEVVTALIDVLSHSDSNVKIYAALVLGNMGTPEVVTALIDILSHSDSDVKIYAEWALEKIRTPEAVPALVPAPSHSDSDVRSDAVEVLGNIGILEAVPALIAALSHSNRDIRNKAASALAKIGTQEAVKALIATLSHSDSEVRIYAAWALGKIGTPEAVRALIATLSHCDSDVRYDVRYYAAWALGKIGTQEAVKALIATLSHSNRDVRSDAAEALKNLGTLDILKQIISSTTINVYEVEIIELVRILFIRYYQEKVPFFPLYPDVIGSKKQKNC